MSYPVLTIELWGSVGMTISTGAYRRIRRRIAELELDTSHFKGQAWLSGTHIRVGGLALREIASLSAADSGGLKQARCECGRRSWRGRSYAPIATHKLTHTAAKTRGGGKELPSPRSPMAEARDLKSRQVWVRIPPGAQMSTLIAPIRTLRVPVWYPYNQ